MKNQRFLAQVLAIACLCGCGGSGSDAPTDETAGNARVTINWPDSVRLIPAASNSITVSFLRSSTVVASQTVARPDEGGSTTVSFTDLPAQNLTLRAQAFPTTNGTGTAQASATQSVTITADAIADLAVVMSSTIESITVTPGITNLVIGGTTTLVGTAVNGSGAAVLVSAETASWASTNPAVATVSPAGVVTALSAGTTTIRYADSESGLVGLATVNVSSDQGDVDVIIK
jgi:hypothetical protein